MSSLRNFVQGGGRISSSLTLSLLVASYDMQRIHWHYSYGVTARHHRTKYFIFFMNITNFGNFSKQLPYLIKNSNSKNNLTPVISASIFTNATSQQKEQI